MAANLLPDSADRSKVFVRVFDYDASPDGKPRVVPIDDILGVGAVRTGEVVLVAGVATIADDQVTANSRIFLSRRLVGGTAGNMGFTRNAGVGFSITNSSNTDTSTVEWLAVG